MLKSSFSLCVFSISISISVCICLLLCFRLSTVFGKRLSHCHCCFIYLTVLVMPRSCVKKFAIRKCALASRSVCFFPALVCWLSCCFPLHVFPSPLPFSRYTENQPEQSRTNSHSLSLSVSLYLLFLFLCTVPMCDKIIYFFTQLPAGVMFI